jgi:hypothetical protein
VRFVKKVRRRKLSSSFNMIKQGITPHVWPCRQFKRTAENSSPIHPAVRIWSSQTTTCSSPWKITWRSPQRDWRGSAGSREKLVARSWHGLLRQRNF